MDSFAAGFGFVLTVAARVARLSIAVVAAAALVGITGAPGSAQTPYVEPAIRGLSRTLTFVGDNSTFQSKWPTLEAARAAAVGNQLNRTLRVSSEIIALNSRCTGKIEYSLYRLDVDIQPLADELAVLKKAYRDSRETTKTKVNAIWEILDRQGYNQSGPCDVIPVELIQKDGTVVSLERDDVGHPLVGSRYNDGYIFEATAPDRPGQPPAEPGVKTGVVNGFPNNRSAINVALRLAGTKVAVVARGKTYLYRATPELLYMSAQDKVSGLKASPSNKDFVIVGVIDGHGATGKAYAIPRN